MNTEYKVIGLIPARFASTRLPGKMLKKIAGKTLIQRVYERVKTSQKLSQVVIVTDHDEIVSHATGFGAAVYKSKFSHESGTDRIGEYLMNGPDCSHVLNIQGDEPFIKPENIDSLIDFIIERDLDIATQAIIMNSDNLYNNPNCVKIVTDLKDHAMYFSRAAIPFKRNHQVVDQSWLRHIGIYAFRKDVLLDLIKLPVSRLETIESLEQLRWLENGYSIGVQTVTEHSMGIDTKEDLEAAEKFAITNSL